MLDNDPNIGWEDVLRILDDLPVEALHNLVSQPEICLKLVRQRRRLREASQNLLKGRMDDAITVEELNSMMMFLAKLLPDELHLLLEYTQMLLDYLTLPAAADWRDTVIAQGKIEGRDPGFHRNLNKLRQQVRVAEGLGEDKLSKKKKRSHAQLEDTGHDDEHDKDSSSSGGEADHAPHFDFHDDDRSSTASDKRSKLGSKDALPAGPQSSQVRPNMPEALADDEIDLMLDDVSFDESVERASSRQSEESAIQEFPEGDIEDQVDQWSQEERRHQEQEAVDTLGTELRDRIEALRRRMGAGALLADEPEQGSKSDSGASGSEEYEPVLQPAIPQAYGNQRNPMASPEMSPRSVPDERRPQM